LVGGVFTPTNPTNRSNLAILPVPTADSDGRKMPCVGNPFPTETNQPTNLTNHFQPLQPYTYYYLTYLLLTTYITCAVLKISAWLDGWSVGRDFCPLSFSKLRFKNSLFQMGVVGGKRNDGQVSRDTCPSALLLPDNWMF
jgi:hypothetical protein